MEVDTQKIHLVQVAYTSEWAVTKFFSALFNHEHGLAEKYVLKAIAGGERDQTEAWRRMIKEAEQRLERVKQQNGSGKKELKDLITTLTLAGKEDIKYFPLDRKGNTLPEHIYKDDFCDAVVIHSANPSHLNYIRYAIRHGLHVLCEKPLVPVIDRLGTATRDDLDELVRINDDRMRQNQDQPEKRYVVAPDAEQFSINRHDKKKYVIAMDAEHYATKKAALMLLEHIGHMRERYGKIVKIEGCVDEIDDPVSERTHSILSLENRTGLLADTGIHLMSVIGALGGEAFRIYKAAYGAYPGYDVETSADVTMTVRDTGGGTFAGEIPCELHVAKFVDRMKTPRPEKKIITFTFENEQEVTANFKAGTVCTKNGGEWGLRKEANPNEYVTILLDFYDAIRQGKEPHTSFSASIKTLDALHRIYSAFPVKENCNNEIYPQ